MEEINANYLITFSGFADDGTNANIPAVLCKDFYAD